MTDTPSAGPLRDMVRSVDNARRAAGWGGKALLVCFMALLMAIPGLFVFSLVSERTHRADGVTAEVSALQGGPQRVLGPILVVPFETRNKKGDAEEGWYVVSPEIGTARGEVKTRSLHRGIFDVPVYDATVDMEARFSPPAEPANLPAAARIDWSRARIVVGFSDLRGAKDDVVAVLRDAKGETRLAFAPASGMALGNPQDEVDLSSPAATGGSGNRFGFVEAPGAAIVDAGAGGTLQMRLHFSGAKRLSLMPFAKSTRFEMHGDWASPSFDGAFLPATRHIASGRFDAAWSVPFIARGLADRGDTGAISVSALAAKDLGVTFARANNPYENVSRALKYAVMFTGLVFLTFFVFEALSGKRVHPAQYLLIGLAQTVFYLLLLSLSEYVGFDVAFACAAGATVALIGFYAGWAFGSVNYRMRALLIFSAVYGLIYLLMRLEDFALLAGSIASFLGLSTAMYLTRNLEWYAGRPSPVAVTAPGADHG